MLVCLLVGWLARLGKHVKVKCEEPATSLAAKGSRQELLPGYGKLRLGGLSD